MSKQELIDLLNKYEQYPRSPDYNGSLCAVALELAIDVSKRYTIQDLKKLVHELKE